MIPTMHPVKSTNIAAIGHDAKTNELHVKFKNGGHYVYEGVSAGMHGAAMKAESVTKWLNQYVKGNFSHRKLG